MLGLAADLAEAGRKHLSIWKRKYKAMQLRERVSKSSGIQSTCRSEAKCQTSMAGRFIRICANAKVQYWWKIRSYASQALFDSFTTNTICNLEFKPKQPYSIFNIKYGGPVRANTRIVRSQPPTHGRREKRKSFGAVSSNSSDTSVLTKDNGVRSKPLDASRASWMASRKLHRVENRRVI